MADSLILMVMALVVFGPRRLPQIGRQIGKIMYEFRKASNDFKFQMEEELRNAEEADRRKKEEEERQRQLASAPSAQLEASPPAATETPASTENAYPYGGNYGEIAEAQEKAAATPPTIQPPATGEPVPATPPGSAALENPTPENAAVAEVEAFIPEVPGAVPEVHGAAAEACAVPAAEESIPPGIENPVSATVNEIAGKATEPAHNG